MDFPGHFQHIFLQLNQQRLHAQLCDCVVVVGGRSFQAHRSILAACSSHFRALLSSVEEAAAAGGSGAGAAGGPSVMELDPEVVTPEAFSTLLDMIYTSTLNLRASNVMDVLLAASHLHLNAVVKACKLHLSRKNFPASPPKGWRSVQQQQQQRSSQAVVEDVCEEEASVEVSQSGGSEDQGGRSEEGAAASLRLKRKAEQEQLGGRKRSCYQEWSPTVTRSSIGTEEACLKTAAGRWEDRGEEEVEEKYEATKGELEEMQLPSQSDSSTDTVVKVQVGEEGEEGAEEPKVALVEVKKENLGSYSPDVDTLDNSSPPSPPQDTETQAESGAASLPSQLCGGLQAEARSEEPVDGEGLESLSELAFSCFLSPSSESVMGALEDDSLAGLTAAATAAAAASDAASAASAGEEPRHNSEATDSSSSSSLVFPVTSVPLQQLLPTQGPGFSDTLILQPAQSSLTGFLSSVRPLEASLVQTSKAGKSSGTTTFRRIAPKVPPGSEVGADHPSGDAADRPALTRASEDVLSKCKKAAAEDHVLLVEGEKKYACKICCKTFMNLTDCKKHIRVHTGEKPYPCPKCGKRFSQSSHLYKHSKNTCLNWKDEQSLPETLLSPALTNP